MPQVSMLQTHSLEVQFYQLQCPLPQVLEYLDQESNGKIGAAHLTVHYKTYLPARIPSMVRQSQFPPSWLDVMPHEVMHSSFICGRFGREVSNA